MNGGNKGSLLLIGLLLSGGAGLLAALMPDIEASVRYALAAVVVLGAGLSFWSASKVQDMVVQITRAISDAVVGRAPTRNPALIEAGVHERLSELATQVKATEDARASNVKLLAEKSSLLTDERDRASSLERDMNSIKASARGMTQELHRRCAYIDDELERMGTGLVQQFSAVDESANTATRNNGVLREQVQQFQLVHLTAQKSAASALDLTSSSEEVVGNVGNLSASVRETVSSIEEMAYSIKEVARNVDALSLTAEETASSMNEMDVSIDQVQSNANETARLSEEVAVDAEQGADSIFRTISEINNIRETANEAMEAISKLGSRIDAIGDILSVIDDVAEQTNLLALNAAIIAAQAGEHGKGFAVVADEIKDLAERAGSSTKEIADLIKTIQHESKNAIEAVATGAKTVDRGVEVSAETEAALKKILESSRKSTTMVRAIARATVEQAKGSRQVTDAIGRIAETVQQIAAATAEQARGSELIMRSAENMRLITTEVERSSQGTARGGRQIAESIDQIATMVGELKEAQRQQLSDSEQSLASAGRIAELTNQYQKQLAALRVSCEEIRALKVET